MSRNTVKSQNPRPTFYASFRPHNFFFFFLKIIYRSKTSAKKNGFPQKDKLMSSDVSPLASKTVVQLDAGLVSNILLSIYEDQPQFPCQKTREGQNLASSIIGKNRYPKLLRPSRWRLAIPSGGGSILSSEVIQSAVFLSKQFSQFWMFLQCFFLLPAIMVKCPAN